MKRLILPLTLLLLLLLSTSDLLAQKEVYDMIGKKMNNVIKTFGKPTYHDKSNPDLECIFYQTKDHRIAFVGNQNGIYQVEKCVFYNGKNAASNSFTQMLKKCCQKGFEVDSLDTYEYELKYSGITMNLSLYENSVLNKFEVRIKASGNEG
ncbi:MAG: hypothetical protein KKA84_11410 [Bacteroidetes bacterium]|nr:hypothetical protein [Bacteroidota bacterium]